MNAARPLLVELGSEELPPKALDQLAAAFTRGVCEGLSRRGIEAPLDLARTFATPRRLAMLVPDVAKAQPDQSIERRGPAVAAALDEAGNPGKALLGFAQSCGVSIAELEKLQTEKGAWFVYRTVKPGQSLAELLPQIVEEALAALPIPRPMRWGNHDYRFVRPVHWLVMLHGSDIIDGTVLGLRSGRKSRGHRFMQQHPIHVVDADSWEEALLAAKVIADPAARRRRIVEQVNQAVRPDAGIPRLDQALLDEIANLTEWPCAIACAFERDFLGVPTEALVSTMETHQKFVPVFDAQGQLTEHFIGVANIQSTDPTQIRKGYERVIRPRFADAKFFWEEDLKSPLPDLQEGLRQVTYQQSLGTLWDKTVRVAELARVVANRVGVDAGAATRAASLARCDLLTRMVGEFPELQGVMGRYYAAAHGETGPVALALDSFYRPRFSGDGIAHDALGQVLAVAERLDTLAGIFAVGLRPTGAKDPFALRRAALGLARTLIEGQLELDLEASFAEALELLPDAALAAGVKPGKDGAVAQLDAGQRRATLRHELQDFVIERLRGYYAEQGYGAALFEAVVAVGPSSLLDFDRRIRAVAAFARLPQAASLAAANKRVANLLRKQGSDAGAPAGAIDTGLFESAVEQALADALATTRSANVAAWEQSDYTAVLTRLATLQAPVDAFFDEVMVNTDDPAVRANRLALLAALESQFTAVADLALL